MKKIFQPLLAVLIAFNFSVVVYAADDMAKANYKAAMDNAAATYKVARAKCDALSGNAKDVCIEEAKANEKRSNANAEAQFKNTPEARMKAHIAETDAAYAVAKEKCKAQSGNAKDVCIKEADAMYTKAKVDAESSKKIKDIKSDAMQEKRDADYKVRLEKCNSLAGRLKEGCVLSAKATYNK